MEHIVFVEATLTGAGRRAIEIAHRRDLRVTLFTRDRSKYRSIHHDADLLDLADEVMDVETNDTGAVCRAAQQLHSRIPISALTTLADFYVPQAAAAAGVLGLPAIPYQAAVDCRNKYGTRLALSRFAPWLNPWFRLASTVEEAVAAAEEHGYPLLVKPRDENDGMDISLVSDSDQLSAHWHKLAAKPNNRAGQPKSPGVILETYMEGPEYSVETVQGGPGRPVRFIGITRKYLTGGDRGCFVELGHCFPVDDHRDIIMPAVDAALHAVGIHTAVCHTEVKVCGGLVKVVEVNPRLAGGRIGSHLVEIATGVNPIDLAIDCALGLDPVWRATPRRGAAIHNIPARAAGRLRSLPAPPPPDSPGLVEYGFLGREGEEVRLPEKNGDLLGYAITSGVDADEAFARARSIADSITPDIV